MVDAQIINTLHEIETILGSIETWPSEIIKLLFIWNYEGRNVFRVISFFYGNKVPAGKALTFYSKFNNHYKILALCHFILLYNMWDMNMHTICTFAFCGYYDMSRKKHMSI